MYRIWAVARHTIAESVRQKFALVLFLLIGLILIAMPFSEGDGATLTSRVQFFLSWTGWLIGLILSILTVLLASLAICDEVKTKRMFMIASKPIPRWQFFAGKWLGIGVLNAAVLLFCFLAVLLATSWLKNRKTNVPGDVERLNFEVLSARHGMELKEPDFTAAIEGRVRRMREEGRLEDIGAGTESEIRSQIYEQLKKSWRSIPPGSWQRYEFKDLMVDREAKGWLHLRFKPTHAGGLSDVVFPALMQFGDVEEPRTLTPQTVDEFVVDRFHTVPIPNYAVNSEGTLYVMMANGDPEYTYTFEGNDSFELLYDLGTFHWNLFRAFAMIWCQLAFLAAVGLFMSSWVSFPVACMASFLVLAAACFSGFLVTALDWSTPMGTAGSTDPLWILGPFLRFLAQVFLWIVPDFSKYDPVDNVVNGRLVPLKWVITSVVQLVLFQALLVGALGSVILSKRELAQETS